MRGNLLFNCGSFSETYDPKNCQIVVTIIRLSSAKVKKNTDKVHLLTASGSAKIEKGDPFKTEGIA